MQERFTAQIEQQHMMAAAGLDREDLVVLYEESTDKLVEVESDLMDIAENKTTGVHQRVFRAFHSVKGTSAHLLHDPGR